jgi:hypothetical protein
MDGIHLIYSDEERLGFFHRQLRGLALLLITMAPYSSPASSVCLAAAAALVHARVW